MNNSPFVSIVIPCRNEEKCIPHCLDSIIANDYPRDRFEILVADGMSEDGTREIVEQYVNRYPFVKLLDNPKRVACSAFNTGIRHARGDLIMLMSAHSACQEDYISKCAKFSREYDADNVGGILITVPGADTLIGKSIALSLSHRFGAGNSHFRVGVKEPVWADTAAFGCYKKEVFSKIGLYNEDLARSSDMDLNIRLKNAGGKTLLIPDVISYYRARPNYKSFCKHNLSNGFWSIYPLKFTRTTFSWRHYIPAVFVSILGGSAALSLQFPVFLWLFLAVLSTYMLVNVCSSIEVAAKAKSIKYLFTMPLIFLTLHIGYGIGSLWGLLRVLTSIRFWKTRFSFFRLTKKWFEALRKPQ